MKIKKNGIIINLNESDLRVIVKKHLNEAKVDFNECVANYPEWLNSHTTQNGHNATELSVKKGYLINLIKKKAVRPLANCEGMKNKGVFNAGIFSKISDKGLKEKFVDKTVQWCRSHLQNVIRDFENGKLENVWGNESHIKLEYIDKIKDGTMFNGAGKGMRLDEFSKTPEFKKEIENLKKIEKCLKMKNY